MRIHNSKSILLVSVLLILGLISCKKSDKITNEKEKLTRKSAQDVQLWIDQINAEKVAAFDDFIKNMPLEEKICQLFIENLEGNVSFKPVEKIAKISDSTAFSEEDFVIPGGYLFFSFNVGNSPEQIMRFISSINEYCSENNKIPPFLAIDQEGGIVNRLRKINGPLPAAEDIANKLELDKAYELYRLQGEQLRLLGFQMNLAPVAEVCTLDNKDFLSGRSFGNPQQVSDYGKECVSAFEKENIGAVLKHFPGNTNTDPHTGLPEIKLSKEDLINSLEPFVELIKTNPAGILMSHARTSALDGDLPACLSKLWVTDILRKEYGYEGIIFSDDIFMAALAAVGYTPEKAVVMAIEAGIDCIMISEKRILKPAKILYKKASEDPVFAKKIDRAVERICRYKMENGQLKLFEDNTGNYSIIVPEYKLNESDLKLKLEQFEVSKEKNKQLISTYYK